MAPALRPATLARQVGDYFLLRQLHEGEFAVFLANHVIEDVTVILKVFPVAETLQMSQYLRELKITKRLSSKPWSVTLLDHFIDNHWGFLVLELQSMDLLTYFQSHSFLDENALRYLFYHICRNVHACHQRKIIHLDVKPENILLDSQLRLMLCDYGCSRAENASLDQCGTGTRWYRAPEFEKNDHVVATPALDVWSLGITLYLLATGGLPAYITDFITAEEGCTPAPSIGFTDLLPEHIPSGRSDGLKDLLCGLLVVDPTKRKTMKQILEHPWFTQAAANETP